MAGFRKSRLSKSSACFWASASKQEEQVFMVSKKKNKKERKKEKKEKKERKKETTGLTIPGFWGRFEG